ncbi:MAG: acyltransferase [Nocardioides sp.]|jgi:peptidoglycan/LPS O-acetylase OafA/YrhL
MTRSNNYDALRLIGAAMVILGHAFHLVGRPAEVPGFLGYAISTFGVVIFFSISGYLITISWVRKRDLFSYFAARLLRIMPALIACVLICVFVIGPLVTSLPVGDYFRSSATWDYLNNLVMRARYPLPGVWEQLPYPFAVNGSLWTLPAEFFCYLVVPLAAVKWLGPRAAILVVLLVGAMYLSQIPPLESQVIWGSRITDAAGMWVFFAAGALIATAEQRWPDIFRTDVAVIVFCVFLLAISLRPMWLPYYAPLTLPYVVLVLGRGNTPYLRRASRFGDLSYGLYLWGFPVQQLVIDYLGVHRMAYNLPLVYLGAGVLAFGSWRLIEDPSLRLKDRIVKLRRREHPVPDPHVGPVS